MTNDQTPDSIAAAVLKHWHLMAQYDRDAILSAIDRAERKVLLERINARRKKEEAVRD